VRSRRVTMALRSLAECAGLNLCRLAESAFANQPAGRPPGGSATLLRFRHSHLGRHVWLRCTSARSVPLATSATKDASRATFFAVELGPAAHAHIATNRLRLQICSNQPFRAYFRRLAKDPLSTGLVDRR
jgi:hypothetical protein